MMGWSAVANGGGVPAGGLVATLQSLGESGRALGLAGRHQDCGAHFTVLSLLHKLTKLSYNLHHTVGKLRHQGVK